MITYPVISLGQISQPISQPLQPGPSSFLTNPKAAIDAKIAEAEDVVAAKLKDTNFRNMLIGGGIGLLAGLLLYPLGQSLMGYTAVKKNMAPQDFAY